MTTPRITIAPATLRDTSYVMAHMRPADEREVLCQFPVETKRHELAYALLHSLEAWVANYKGQPIAVFGVSHMTVACVSVWALGTHRMWRAVPAITRFVKDSMVPRLVEVGYQTMEARSHVDHHQAHRWMVATGAVQADQPYVFGRGGEKFVTFRWTSEPSDTKAQP